MTVVRLRRDLMADRMSIEYRPRIDNQSERFFYIFYLYIKREISTIFSSYSSYI